MAWLYLLMRKKKETFITLKIVTIYFCYCESFLYTYNIFFCYSDIKCICIYLLGIINAFGVSATLLPIQHIDLK